MAYFLFRPHIDFGDKVVTTDFVLRDLEVVLPGHAAIPLPIDILSATTSLQAREEETLVAPTLLVVAGDGSLFAAPAIAVVDGRILKHHEELAWSHARISVARRAVVVEKAASIPMMFEGEETPPINLGEGGIAGRRRATIVGCGEVRKASVPAKVTLTIGSSVQAAHQLSLARFTMGDNA